MPPTQSSEESRIVHTSACDVQLNTKPDPIQLVHQEESNSAQKCDLSDTAKSLDTSEEASSPDSSERPDVLDVDLTPKPPDGGWGWMVVLGCVIGHMLLVGLMRGFGIIFVVLLERFETTGAAAAWVHSLYNFIRMGTGPLVGYLAQRYTCRLMAVVGGLILATGCVISSFATSIFYLYFSFGVLAGLGGGLIFTPMFIMLNQYFDKNKGKAMAFSTLGSGLGNVALSPLLVYLLQEYSYSGTFLILGAIMLHTCFAGSLFRPLRMPKKVVKDIHETEEALNTNGTRATKETGNNIYRCCPCKCSEGFKEGLKPLTNITFLLYCLLIISMPFCIQASLVFVPSLCKEQGLSQTQAAFLLSIFGFADVTGRFFFGIIFDLKWIRPQRRPVHSCIGIVMGIIVISLSFISTFPLLLVAVVLWGFFEAGFHSQWATIQTSFLPKSQLTSVMGIIIFCQGVGNLSSSTIGGVLADATGTFKTPFQVAGSFIILTSAIFLLEFYLRHALRQKSSTTCITEKL